MHFLLAVQFADFHCVFQCFFCMGSGRLRGAHRGASGQPGAPSTRGGKTAEAGAARGESVEFPRPGVEKSRKSKGLYHAKVHDIST